MAGLVVSGIRHRRVRWEEHCNRCGLCCYRKDVRRGRIHINLTAPCRFLDLDSGLCTVYDRRFRECGDCIKVTVLHALFSRLMPEGCGYVQRYRRWRLPVGFPLISGEVRSIRHDSVQHNSARRDS